MSIFIGRCYGLLCRPNHLKSGLQADLEGIAKGLAKGKAEGMKQVVKSMLDNGFELQQIVAITGLSEDGLKALTIVQ